MKKLFLSITTIALFSFTNLIYGQCVISPDAVISGGGTICEGTQASITLNFTAGTAPYTVSFSTPYTQPIPPIGGLTDGFTIDTFTVAGTYSITQIVDANGCVMTGNPISSVDVFVVDLPDDAGYLIGPENVCPLNGEQMYSITPVNNATTYIWGISPVLPLVENAENVNVDFTGLPAGTYSISVTPQNACGSGSTSTLEIDVLPEINPRVSLTDPSPLCFGEEVTWEAIATGTGGVPPTFEWSVGGALQLSDTDAMRTLAFTQQVDVEVTTNYACSSVPIVSASIFPYVVFPPSPSLSIQDDEFCELDGPYDLNLNVIEDPDQRVSYSYSWYRNNVLIVTTSAPGHFPVNRTGTYKVEASNNVCDLIGSDELQITVYEHPIVDAGPPVVILQGETGKLTGSTSVIGEIEWTPNFINLDNPYWYETSFKKDTTVEDLLMILTVTNEECVGNDMTSVTIIDSPSDELAFAYPNTTSSTTTIALKKSGILSVWDMQGVFHFQLEVAKGTKELDFSFLPNGQYIVRLDANDGSTGETRVMKQ